eukprot:TRINITY_DN4558_c0_g1_i1.p1 TRINITY_DN4558_c0_g1~~TRINITY_DN4558_c0_g1_i1.p1  ORF type:complete len:504 (+),score=14.16 TRINITY_DN4558_c0_g1_i1:237-1748(+)
MAAPWQTTRRFPPPAAAAAPPLGPTGGVRRRRTFSWSLYFSLLFRQTWPFILVLIGLGFFISYYSVFTGRDASISQPVAHDLNTAEKERFIASEKPVASTATSNKPPALAQPKKFHDTAPLFGFVHFATYRTGAKTFGAIGLSGTVLRDVKKLGKCTWKERGGGHRTEGSLQAFYPGDHHGLRYEAVMMLCKLDESTEHDTGGELHMTIDGSNVLVYTETAGTYIRADPRPPYKHNLVYCSPPIHRKVDLRRIHEWIEYHLKQGVDYMMFYDAGGIDEEFMAMLDPYAKMKLVEVVDTRLIHQYESWAHGHLMVLNDCSYRMRFKAQWVLNVDLNEYYDSEDGITLKSVLANHTGVPYVTFGSRWWSLEKCAPQSSTKDDWAVQRMLYHWPHMYCVNKEDYPRLEMCLDYYGFRKYAADPRKVTAGQIHRVEMPRAGGYDVDGEIARFNRWNGLIELDSKACSHTVDHGEVVDWWQIDTNVADTALAARAKPVAQFKGLALPN